MPVDPRRCAGLGCRSAGPAWPAREEAASVRCGIGSWAELWHRLLGRAASESGRLRHEHRARGPGHRRQTALMSTTPSDLAHGQSLGRHRTPFRGRGGRRAGPSSAARSGIRPRFGGRIACVPFTISDLRVHHPDPGVHHERSGCSRCTDPGVHDGVIRAFTMGRYAQSRRASAQDTSRKLCRSLRNKGYIAYPETSGRFFDPSYASTSSSARASWRSAVSKPSVNQA